MLVVWCDQCRLLINSMCIKHNPLEGFGNHIGFIFGYRDMLHNQAATLEFVLTYLVSLSNSGRDQRIYVFRCRFRSISKAPSLSVLIFAAVSGVAVSYTGMNLEGSNLCITSATEMCQDSAVIRSIGLCFLNYRIPGIHWNWWEKQTWIWRFSKKCKIGCLKSRSWKTDWVVGVCGCCRSFPYGLFCLGTESKPWAPASVVRWDSGWWLHGLQWRREGPAYYCHLVNGGSRGVGHRRLPSHTWIHNCRWAFEVVFQTDMAVICHWRVGC